jgi:glutaredoxin 2
MNSKERDQVLARIDSEWFDYTFADYSTFDDPRFHKLQLAHFQTRGALKGYLKNRTTFEAPRFFELQLAYFQTRSALESYLKRRTPHGTV